MFLPAIIRHISKLNEYKLKLDMDFTDKKIFHEFWGYSTIQEFIDKSLYPDEQNLDKTMSIERLVKNIEEKTKDAVVKKKSPVKEIPHNIIPSTGPPNFYSGPPHPDTILPAPRPYPQPSPMFYPVGENDYFIIFVNFFIYSLFLRCPLT